ncbi:MAG TPA: acyl-CoA dehydrogenase family protein [Steroidobacteraceae bacterium]|nr:acyl-CoA dehydrogenase family protein [Steroidobacteraceae bacterium]
MEAPSIVEAAVSAPAPAAADIKSRAAAVAAVAARHAGDVDQGSRFPAEAFAAVRAQRLLGIMVPRSLGGEGASLGQVADVCYELARACSSTGMIYAMHQVKVACLTRHHGASRALAAIQRRLCAEQLLLASSTTEGKAGGNVRSSEAPVEHKDGRISLNRAATVISYGAHADGVVTTARRAPDAAPSDQVLVAFLKSDYTLTRLQGWNTLGMRGTCSDGYTLLASGTPDQILPEPYETIHAHTMVPTAHLLWGSVWTGIAASATERAQAFIRQAVRQSGGQTPPGAPQFTKALATLRTLRGMLAAAMRTYTQAMADPQALSALGFQSMITMTKVEASELAVSVVLMALRVCGLTGYRCDSEFSVERQLRDVLSSPLMINNDRILTNLATPSLMTPIPASIQD